MLFYKRQIFLLKSLVFVLFFLPACGSSNHLSSTYEIQQIRVAQNGSRFVKVWAVAKNADQAIDEAMKSAVEACLFKGIEANSIAGYLPPLCPDGIDSYRDHKDYFDNFFDSKEYLHYVTRANSHYPTGEDNISYQGQRRVGIYVQLKVSELRHKIENDGIIKSFDNIWEIKK